MERLISKRMNLILNFLKISGLVGPNRTLALAAKIFILPRCCNKKMMEDNKKIKNRLEWLKLFEFPVSTSNIKTSLAISNYNY